MYIKPTPTQQHHLYVTDNWQHMKEMKLKLHQLYSYPNILNSILSWRVMSHNCYTDSAVTSPFEIR